MKKHLYEFLKSKGDRFELCYADESPFLVAGKIDTELMEEYADSRIESFQNFLIMDGQLYIEPNEVKRNAEIFANDDVINIDTRNWFEKLPLHWKLAYHMIGGIIMGYMLHYLW